MASIPTGNPVGRPRTVSLQPDEMIKLGQQMVEWVYQNDPLHLSQWYCIHMGISRKDWKNMIETAEFSPYYEQALQIVGQKYLDKNSNVREGASQRWQRVYFKDLREEEDETARFKSSLASQENKALFSLSDLKKAAVDGELSQ